MACTKSTDGGGIWGAAAHRPAHDCHYCPGIDPAAPATLYAGRPLLHCLYKSTDGGETWNAANTNLPTYGDVSLS